MVSECAHVICFIWFMMLSPAVVWIPAFFRLVINAHIICDIEPSSAFSARCGSPHGIIVCQIIWVDCVRPMALMSSILLLDVFDAIAWLHGDVFHASSANTLPASIAHPHHVLIHYSATAHVAIICPPERHDVGPIRYQVILPRASGFGNVNTSHTQK